MWVLGHVYIEGHWRSYEMVYDNDSQSYPWMDGAYGFPTFALQLRKNLNQEHRLDRGSIPDPLHEGSDVTPRPQRWALQL